MWYYGMPKAIANTGETKRKETNGTKEREKSIVEYCAGCFSIAVIRHHDQSSL